MANLARVRVVWSGAPVIGGGVSTFFVDEAATGFLSDIRGFFDAIDLTVTGGITWSFPSTGDLIDIATGELTGSWSETPAADVNSTGSGVHAAGVGTRATWRTSGIRNGRRVVGSTFIVPLHTGSYATDGTIDTATLTLLRNAADSLLTDIAGALRVYSRPSVGVAGQASPVISSNVPDKVSWLRSRRT